VLSICLHLPSKHYITSLYKSLATGETMVAVQRSHFTCVKHLLRSCLLDVEIELELACNCWLHISTDVIRYLLDVASIHLYLIVGTIGRATRAI
jgi:hypothetical protein